MALPTAVLIVNYLVYADLERALSSLDPWLSPGDEVVVVDQASDAPRLAAVRARHPRVTFVANADNTGFAAGVNAAARHSTAPCLLLLNPDAFVEGPLLSVLSRWLDVHPETGVVGPRVLNADGTVQASARRFPGWSTALGGRSTWLTRRFPRNWLSTRNLYGRESADPISVDWLAGSCLMTRRDVFDRVGGFDEGFFLYWEDADYCERVRRQGLRCMLLPSVTVRHIGGRSSERNPAPSIRAFHRSAYRLYRKYASPLRLLAAPFVYAALVVRGEWLARRASSRWRSTQANRVDADRVRS